MEITPHMLERFWSHVDIRGPEECWPWQAFINRHGYGVFYLADGKKIPASRFALATVMGWIPSELYACHHCDQPVCCNPAHIFAGTPKDNTQDAIAKGRLKFRERKPKPPKVVKVKEPRPPKVPKPKGRPKLDPALKIPYVRKPKPKKPPRIGGLKISPEVVREVRKQWWYVQKHQADIGAQFGISAGSVSQIVTEKVYEEFYPTCKAPCVYSVKLKGKASRYVCADHLPAFLALGYYLVENEYPPLDFECCFVQE
jgi:hypothetical protein